MAQLEEPPTSYSSLPFQHIRLSHVPVLSPTPTPIILITLYRPQAKNAFTDLMAQELVRAFCMISSDPRVKVAVITGDGSVFCAGADLQAGLSYTHETLETHRDGGGQVALAIHNCNKPVIAAINGHAVGVGITLTLPCSIRIVSNKAKVGFVFARRGIVMEAASSFFLPRLIGYSRATHLTTTGSVYPSFSPLFDTLFSEILPEEKVLERAIEIAKDVAENTSTVSTKLMRDLMWKNPGGAEETHLLDSKVLFELFEGRDKKEGVESFLQKRKADFKGTMAEDKPSVWPWGKKVETKVIEKEKAKL
jgi:enoyl-CoA hydratase/carnithine racemase